MSTSIPESGRSSIRVVRRDLTELIAEPLGAESVRDPQPGRVVGDGEVLAARQRRAVSAMSSIEVVPSDQLVWACRSPRSWSPVSAFTSSRPRRSRRYSGTRPSSAWVITLYVVSPMPLVAFSRTGSLRMAGSRSVMIAAALRNAFDL